MISGIFDLTKNKYVFCIFALFLFHSIFRVINLKDNKLKMFPATEIFTGFHTTLHTFDISGDSNIALSLQDLKR